MKNEKVQNKKGKCIYRMETSNIKKVCSLFLKETNKEILVSNLQIQIHQAKQTIADHHQIHFQTVKEERHADLLMLPCQPTREAEDMSVAEEKREEYEVAGAKQTVADLKCIAHAVDVVDVVILVVLRQNIDHQNEEEES